MRSHSAVRRMMAEGSLAATRTVLRETSRGARRTRSVNVGFSFWR